MFKTNGNTRKLSANERPLTRGLGPNAKRQSLAAQRTIEGLNQNDQIIALLADIRAELAWAREHAQGA